MKLDQLERQFQLIEYRMLTGQSYFKNYCIHSAGWKLEHLIINQTIPIEQGVNLNNMLQSNTVEDIELAKQIIDNYDQGKL